MRMSFAYLTLAFCIACSSSPETSTDVIHGADAPDTVSSVDVVEVVDIVEVAGADAGVDAAPELSPLAGLPVAACGMPAYEVIAPDQVGEVVDWVSVDFWDQRSASLDGFLGALGFTALSPLPYGSQMYRLRYTTQDRGEIVEASALVALPRDRGEDAGPLSVILFAHGTSGYSAPCAPSHPDNNLIGPVVPATMAAMGYMVVAPDFIGMMGYGTPTETRHAYIVGEQVALGSWDALRAAYRLLDELPEPPEVERRVLPWGASQGGHAAFFIERYAPYYAPEFEVPGVVTSVTPTDLRAMWSYNTTGLRDSSGMFTAGLVTMNLWYGEAGDLETVLTNEEPLFLADTIPEVMFPQEECKIDVNINPSDLTLDDVFPPDYVALVEAEDWAALEPWTCYLKENSVSGSSVPPLRTTPTFVVLAEYDELLPVEFAREDFVRLCEDGWLLEHLECADAGHVDAALWSLPEQFAWAAERLAGQPIPTERACVLHDPVRCEGTPADAE